MNTTRVEPPPSIQLASGRRLLQWVLLGCCGLLWAACQPSPLPELRVEGAAKSSLSFENLEAIRSLGVVTKYRVRVTRRAGPPPGALSYRLVDPSGRELSGGPIEFRSSYDFREPFGEGDSFTLSIPAYRGESMGRTVARIEVEVTAAPLPQMPPAPEPPDSDALPQPPTSDEPALSPDAVPDASAASR